MTQIHFLVSCQRPDKIMVALAEQPKGWPVAVEFRFLTLSALPLPAGIQFYDRKYSCIL
ncbi:ash family protein [Leclercia adecarboxylata]|uniref:ash family protein n=1 Tax=Leclercia adecarboxylata TaxID=83655 RepID=UPI0016434E9F|nr:ash family protein [Leclercia adecarboxylata]MBK0350328.1 ash family protein [Leclercia adecarboxylata]QNP34329.1 ash family protein [Leclercia adecarboxylata]